MRTTELDRETKRATEPAKAWRNRYWSGVPIPCNGAVGGPGNYWGPDIWPTAEIAEAYALSYVRWCGYRGAMVAYLGAFPVSE